MDIRIDKRDNGFRVRWHHNGQQGRELFATALELQSWLSRFDFDAGRPVSVEEEAARSFSGVDCPYVAVIEDDGSVTQLSPSIDGAPSEYAHGDDPDPMAP